MIKLKNFLGLLAVFSLLISGLLQAKEVKQANLDDIRTYMELSGFTAALNAVPQQINAMGQQMQLTAKNPEASTQVVSTLLNSWQSDAIVSEVAHYIQQELTAKQLSQLLDWLATDLSKRIKFAEEQANRASFQQDFLHFSADIQSNPPAADSIEAVRQLVESTKMVENMSKMVSQIAHKVAFAMLETQPEAVQAAKTQEINQQLANMETMIRPGLEQQMMMVSLYLYRDISNQDLAAYARFYQTELGQLELEVLSGAMVNSMSAWAEKFSRQMLELNENKPAS